jgi:myo-inositol-1(or 4)-monophosphatase
MIGRDKLGEFRQFSERAARVGGQILVKHLGKVSPFGKPGGELVTRADLESQSAIEKLVTTHFPQHSFVGEENCQSLSSTNGNCEFCWIVDPLDGTVNYVHKLPGFGVSVALRYLDQIVVGTVFDPLLNECFSAATGFGATLNDQPIRVGNCQTLAGSLLVCSLPMHLRRDSAEVRRLLNVTCDGGATFRRLGSAALNLCYVACGRLDGYWSSSARQWDVAAGSLIVSEAGGSIRHLSGADFNIDDPQLAACANVELLKQLIPLLDVE